MFKVQIQDVARKALYFTAESMVISHSRFLQRQLRGQDNEGGGWEGGKIMKAKRKVGSGTKMLHCFRGTVVERHLKADSNSVNLWFSSVYNAGVSSITMEPSTNCKVSIKNEWSKPQRSEHAVIRWQSSSHTQKKIVH